MIVYVASPSSPPSPLSSSSLFLASPIPSLVALYPKTKNNIWRQLQKNRNKGCRKRSGVCRAEFVHDAPFAAAIGACVLNSLVFPISADETEDEDGGGTIDATDARFAVMGIISFIPYFNWLGWVFAWMDSDRQRYLVYSIVYLAPYLRTNLSLSPEESWLPIASILVCILHIQLEVSIRNGDIKGIHFLDEAKKLHSLIRKRETKSKSHQQSAKKERSKRHMGLPSSHGLRDEVKEWGIPRKQNEELDVDEKKNKSQ
ncbi:hypothetical protein OPV22_002948 [Ensete ventricosum]|uniref:Uncharacterized protein n=1 Tax=Ensete ventricosum TaxID=4639 RepID=A0AAV8RZJ6_ENSVE|nr:hypothetical protein OPV22_002948 [Ensete ventricosum]